MESKLIALELMDLLPAELLNVCVADAFSKTVAAENHAVCVLSNLDAMINGEDECEDCLNN